MALARFWLRVGEFRVGDRFEYEPQPTVVVNIMGCGTLSFRPAGLLVDIQGRYRFKPLWKTDVIVWRDVRCETAHLQTPEAGGYTGVEHDDADIARVQGSSVVRPSHSLSTPTVRQDLLTRSPLMPIVHWPSFSQQLIAREDERSDTWRAFLLSLGEYLRRSPSILNTQYAHPSRVLHHPASPLFPRFHLCP